MNAARTVRWAVAATLMTMLTVGAPAGPRDHADATAPTASLCNSNPSFCGYTLHAKNGTTSVLPSKSFGAHMGVGWQMATGPNNTTALGFCLDDQFGGVPAGAVHELPVPSGWTAGGMAEAAWILAVYAGDRVSPYQPIPIDAAGDPIGYTVRQRYLAVHLALLSVLPNHNANGSYSALLDPASLQLFADVAGTTPSAQQAVVPLVAQMVAAARSHHAAGSAIVLDATETTPGVVTVTATKDGLPVPDLPVWPADVTGVTFTGATAGQAHANAVLLGWPSLDYDTVRQGAGLTDANGQATFTASPAALSAGVEFRTEEPPAGVHQYGDGVASQANLTWIAGEIRQHSTDVFRLDLLFLASQISSATPAPGDAISDSIIVELLADGVTATVEVELFDLTADPTGAGIPLVHVQVAGLGNGTTAGLAPYATSVAQAGHTLGYRHRAVALSDGSLAAPTEWSVLGIPSETGTVLDLVTAEIHLRKSVTNDGVTWINAQTGTVPSYGPAPEPADPRAGSFDDGAPDPDDGVPVYMAGDAIEFAYEVWLDVAATGVVTWPGAPAGVVTDDDGTPAPADDWQAVYVDGDDGDGLLEPGETWRYASPAPRFAIAGEQHRNMAYVPAGDVHRPSNPAGPVEGATTRQDPAGYQVPALATSASAPGGGQRLSPAGGTVVDIVTYRTLVPGVAVTVSGEVQRLDDTGDAVATAVVGATTFTPESAEGAVEVSFDVPLGWPSGTYVVFETLTVDGLIRAQHADPADAAQMFEVVVPSLATAIASPVDGSQVLAPAGGQMVDEVCYSDLYVPDAVVEGELQSVEADGSVTPTGVTGSTGFAPATPDGCVEVEFVVPAVASGARFVAFERLVVDGLVLAAHEDPTDVRQSFVQRRNLEVTTRTCSPAVTAPEGATAGLTCDRVTVHADPGDVVLGTVTAYPWSGGARRCDLPGPTVNWSVTVGADGIGTVETPQVAVPIGPDWEWVEAAWTADGRQYSRDCATAPRDSAESFEMRRGGGGGDHLPDAGGNVRLPLMIAGWVVVAGAVLVAVPFVLRARRRGLAVALVAGCAAVAVVLVFTLSGGGSRPAAGAARSASAATSGSSTTAAPSSTAPASTSTSTSDVPASTSEVSTTAPPTTAGVSTSAAATTTVAATTTEMPAATAAPPATAAPATTAAITVATTQVAGPRPTTTIAAPRTTSFSFTVEEHHCFAPCTITVSAPRATKVVLFAPGGVLAGSGPTGAVGTGGHGVWRVEVTAPPDGFAWTWTT